MSEAVPAAIGSVSHYNLLEALEPSGPGALFRARDTRLGRTVTVRLLPPEYAAGAAERTAFFERAAAMKALSHPNVIALFDAGEHDGRAYLVFEYLRGQSLRAEMAGRPMNVRRAVELAIQIADGVADAHVAGFIHGGLSPDTVIVTAKGHAKIPAFDLASLAGFEEGPHGSRLRDYGSPEEARGQEPDERSDIHSVGAVLFEMLTARRPSHKGAASPSATNPHVPPELAEVVLRAVAPNADARYQSIVTFAAELRSTAAILDVRGGAGDEDGDAGAVPSAARSRGAMVAVGLAVVVVAAVLWFALHR